MITRFVVYGAIGCLMEVLWTGLGSLKSKDFKLRSSTSLWMFFIYGMVAFFAPMFRIIAPMPFMVRGLFYAACIFAGEFTTGMLLKRVELCPWDYSGARFHVKGVIRLDYLPAWVVAGLFFEYVYWWMV